MCYISYMLTSTVVLGQMTSAFCLAPDLSIVSSCVGHVLLNTRQTTLQFPDVCAINWGLRLYHLHGSCFQQLSGRSLDSTCLPCLGAPEVLSAQGSPSDWTSRLECNSLISLIEICLVCLERAR